MNDKKRSLRMRDLSDSLPAKGFGGMKISFLIPPPLNFSNRTITAFDLQGKTNFKNAIFTGSILNDITFKNVDFTGANFLNATLNGVTFENCNLTKAIFSLAKLNKNTSFINCILSNSFFVDSDSELYNVTFKSCTFTGVNFSGAKIFKNAIFTESILNDATFKNVDFTGANFFKATLNGVIFENCNLTKAIFSLAKLNKNTSFINCILSNSFFVDSDSELYNVTFKSCTFTGVNFSGAKIFKNAIFTESILNDATFKNVDFIGANFFKATLNGVTFESCTLTGVNFSEANLYTKIIEPSGDNEDSQYIYTKFVNIDQFNNALFKKAKLYGVSFENCNLTKADFSEADLKFILDEEQDGEEGEGYLFTFFVDVNLEEANFTSAFLNSVSFVAVNLKKTNFTKAYLLKLNNLLDVYLEDTLFVSATIKELDFSYANYYPENPENINKDGIFLGLDFSNADLEDVKFRSKRYVEVNFSKAQLTNVNLSFSDLTGSNFSEATLTNVKLSNTNFTDADLSEAQFIYAIQDYVNSNIKFNGANLNNAYFKNCLFERFSFDDATDFGDTITSFFNCVIYIDNSNPIDEAGNYPYGYFIDNVYVDNCEIYIIS